MPIWEPRPWVVRRHGWGLVALCLLCGSCAPGGSTTRIVNGRQLQGRFVSDVAYAMYLRGAYHEARGDYRAALQVYREAARADDESPELWTRIGAMRCVLGHAEIRAAFREAERHDPDYAPLWLERARCALLQDDAARALQGARRAVSADPGSAPASLLVAQVLLKQRRPAAAERWLRALLLRDASSRAAVWALLMSEPRHWHALRRRLSREEGGERLRQGGVALEPHATRCGPQDERCSERASARSGELLAEAIARSDLRQARTHAARAGIRPARLAVKLLAGHQYELALQQALLVLRANPASSDARIVALTAADLLNRSDLFHEALTDLPASPTLPSPEALEHLADLLERSVGPAASRPVKEAATRPAL